MNIFTLILIPILARINIKNRETRINMYFNHQNDKLFEKNRTNINNLLSGLF